MRKFMIRNGFFALLLILATGISAAEKIKTVDVIPAKVLGDFWGVEFPIEGAEAEPTMGSTLYLDPKGDLVVQFSYSGGIKDKTSTRYSLLYHVAQKKILHREKKNTRLAQEAPETEQDRYIQENKFIKIKVASFKMGEATEKYGYVYYTSKYIWISIVGGDSCRPDLDSEIRVKDVNGRLVAAKIILYTSHKKIGHHSAQECEYGDNGSPVPRKITTKALSIDNIWKIDDDSVLVNITDTPYLIRLTPKLNSPFIENHPDICFFRTGFLMPLRDKLFLQQLHRMKSGEDIHVVVDNILFNLIQQHNENLPIK